jgi:hypothetical protein
MTTPSLQLRTMFVLDDDGRILSTREPGGSRGPLFCLVRGRDACAWAIRADLPKLVADEVLGLAGRELPTSNFRDPPTGAADFLAVLADCIAPGCDVLAKRSRSDGPAFVFPKSIARPSGVSVIEDEALLVHGFGGFLPGEIAAGRSPVMAILEGGRPVSVCYCARASSVAAEAGVDTVEAWRGRGFGPRVVAAWALAVQASGRIPLYSTAWTNGASLAVARKLGLSTYASDWSLYD